MGKMYLLQHLLEEIHMKKSNAKKAEIAIPSSLPNARVIQVEANGKSFSSLWAKWGPGFQNAQPNG